MQCTILLKKVNYICANISYFMSQLYCSSKKKDSPRNGGKGIFFGSIRDDFKRANFLELTPHCTRLHSQDL